MDITKQLIVVVSLIGSIVFSLYGYSVEGVLSLILARLWLMED